MPYIAKHVLANGALVWVFVHGAIRRGKIIQSITRVLDPLGQELSTSYIVLIDMHDKPDYHAELAEDHVHEYLSEAAIHHGLSTPGGTSVVDWTQQASADDQNATVAVSASGEACVPVPVVLPKEDHNIRD